MKKSLLLMAIAFTTGVVTASATCWRINPSPYAGAQFKTVADAMNNIDVLSGDTLLLDPGTHGTIDISTRKNITIIGAGYFLDKNKDWAESQSTILGYVTLSDGSKIEGCDASSINTSYSSNCTISRCKAGSITADKSSLVTDCYITSSLSLRGSSIGRNNIIYSGNTFAVYGGDGVIFENNTVYSIPNGGWDNYAVDGFSNSFIRNNIIINAKEGFDNELKPYSTHIWHGDFKNNVVQNNVFSIPSKYADQTMPNNLYVGATIENTFVNEGSDDAKWQLLDSSAAKGAATHGGDCGAFGGPTPYVLSGIPQFLPHITEALVPAKPTDGKITVKLKIANQNE